MHKLRVVYASSDKHKDDNTHKGPIDIATEFLNNSVINKFTEGICKDNSSKNRNQYTQNYDQRPIQAKPYSNEINNRIYENTERNMTIKGSFKDVMTNTEKFRRSYNGQLEELGTKENCNEEQNNWDGIKHQYI